MCFIVFHDLETTLFSVSHGRRPLVSPLVSCVSLASASASACRKQVFGPTESFKGTQSQAVVVTSVA